MGQVQNEFYIGNKWSKSVHIFDCHHLRDTKEGTRTFFDTLGKAFEDGYKACTWCLPDKRLTKPNYIKEGCYCSEEIAIIHWDLKNNNVPEESLVNTDCCWRRICQVKGFFNSVDTNSSEWSKLCAKSRQQND